jgi:hypothetical protein
VAGHQLDQLLQPAQRPDQYGDAGQLPVVVPAQHVDSLHIPAVEFSLELKRRAGLVVPLREVAQGGS